MNNRPASLREPGTMLLESLISGDGSRRSLLFQRPARVWAPESPGGFRAMLDEIDQWRSDGYWIAGALAYEAGYGFEPGRLPEAHGSPLAWMAAYRAADVAAVPDITSLLPSRERWDAGWRRHIPRGMTISREDYLGVIGRILDAIARGDVYQINFTDRIEFECAADPPALYAELRERQPVAYAAYLEAGDWRLVSFSPELFFRLDAGTISVRPMKGTASRGRWSAEDRDLAAFLSADSKNRAENLMIVDLLRNDLGRIAEPGSVRVPELFVVERYRTLHQMTSRVSARPRPGLTIAETLRALFPCGSITGAPKIRAMQLIRELERTPRGFYCGAIGFFAPDGDAAFSVAIRTLRLQDGRATLGVGSGVVWDSEAEAEYDECLLKARFLTAPPEPPFSLIETLLWDGGGFPLLAGHLRRLEDSAGYFLFPVKRDAIERELNALGKGLPPGLPYKVRLLLDSRGEVTLEAEPHAPVAAGPLPVGFASESIDSADRFQHHKTTRRDRYDRWTALARERGWADALFLNEREELAEGAVSTVFVENECGTWVTPPRESGALPGVFRETLLAARPEIEVRAISREEVLAARRIWLGNAVRGLREAVLVRESATRR